MPYRSVLLLIAAAVVLFEGLKTKNRFKILMGIGGFVAYGIMYYIISH